MLKMRRPTNRAITTRARDRKIPGPAWILSCGNAARPGQTQWISALDEHVMLLVFGNRQQYRPGKSRAISPAPQSNRQWTRCGQTVKMVSLALKWPGRT